MSEKTEVLRVTPRFPTLDMQRTVEFYREKMGFVSHYTSDEFSIMSRFDRAFELQFWRCDDPHIAEMTACYVSVRNIERLYAEYEAQGILHPNAHLQVKPHGMKEFGVVDLDGNLILFGEAVE